MISSFDVARRTPVQVNVSGECVDVFEVAVRPCNNSINGIFIIGFEALIDKRGDHVIYSLRK